MKIVRRIVGLLPRAHASLQIGGAGCLAAAAYLAWGLAAGIAVAGGLLLAFGVAAERGE